MRSPLWASCARHGDLKVAATPAPGLGNAEEWLNAGTEALAPVVEIRPPAPLNLMAASALFATNPAQLWSMLGFKIVAKKP